MGLLHGPSIGLDCNCGCVSLALKCSLLSIKSPIIKHDVFMSLTTTAGSGQRVLLLLLLREPI